jgi:hypothetical protein
MLDAEFWKYLLTVYKIYGGLALMSRDQIKSKGVRLDWVDLFFEQILDWLDDHHVDGIGCPDLLGQDGKARDENDR